MAEEDLLKAVEEDARAQAQGLIQDAEKEAAGIVEEAESEAASVRAERLGALSEAMARRRTALINGARIRTAALKLEARLGVIEEAVVMAVKRLKGLPEDKYRILLNRFFKELERRWQEAGPGTDPVVFVNPADVDIIEDQPVEIRPDADVSLGVVFASADGRIRFENTVETRIKRARPEIVMDLDKLLFS
ncbi:MAG: hypothetical protein BMS9Abin23_0503 [Thermodesulfobacteriota bacterium]|nr:MAG: hypothetical protein BMS9Abin23_0503 [Thermodesulfobacteriota bacterium]